MGFRYFINYFLWISPWLLLGVIVFIVAIIFFLKNLKREENKEEDKLIKIDEFHNVLPLIDKIEEYFDLRKKHHNTSFLYLREILSEIKNISNEIIPIIFDEYLICCLHEIIDKIDFIEKHLDDRNFMVEALKDLEETFEKIMNWYQGENDEI
ncbi:MAG: hypothetical protein DRP84_11975 [Spirochaetes bacterium]|nr:MAG: hypothetical protein DRP84_11975 [Spirochaetota bacterium]